MTDSSKINWADVQSAINHPTPEKCSISIITIKHFDSEGCCIGAATYGYDGEWIAPGSDKPQTT